MFLEDFNLRVLHMLSEYWMKRVVAIDIETHVEGSFLKDEYILGVAMATRMAGELTDASGIEVRNVVLDDESEESEVRLLEQANHIMNQYRALGLLGYAHRGYDVPLLILKLSKYKKPQGQPLWKLVDVLEQAVHVDLQFILKTKFGMKNLREATEAAAFKDLPLRREKHLVSTDFAQKGKDILDLWRNNRQLFIRYMEADAVNPLLIAEYLLKSMGGNSAPQDS
jgi:DNA polymerase elongation subunit (family B)